MIGFIPYLFIVINKKIAYLTTWVLQGYSRFRYWLFCIAFVLFTPTPLPRVEGEDEVTIRPTALNWLNISGSETSIKNGRYAFKDLKK